VGTTVRDKDGIGAALAVLSLAARARSGGESLVEAYDALEAAHGVHLTGQITVPTQEPVQVMSRLRIEAPAELAGEPITATSDLTGGTDKLPSADVLRYWLRGARVVIRPSGTEPKIKAYLEIVEPVIAGRLTEAPGRTGKDGAASRRGRGPAERLNISPMAGNAAAWQARCYDQRT
jgi:phosphomannomutase